MIFGVARHDGPEYRFDVRGPEWAPALGEQVPLVRETGAAVAVPSPTPKPKPKPTTRCRSACRST